MALESYIYMSAELRQGHGLVNVNAKDLQILSVSSVLSLTDSVVCYKRFC